MYPCSDCHQVSRWQLSISGIISDWCRLQVWFCSKECIKDSVTHKWICKALLKLSDALAAEREIEDDNEVSHQVRFVLRFFGEYIHEVISKSTSKVLKYAFRNTERFDVDLMQDVRGLLSLIGHQEHQTDYERWLFKRVAQLAADSMVYTEGNYLRVHTIFAVCCAYFLRTAEPARVLGTLLSEEGIINLLCIARCNRFGLYGYGEECAGTVMSKRTTISAHAPRTYCLL